MTTPSSISEPHRNNGFTLVELLVTIAIIAPLAEVLFTAFRSLRTTANQSTSASNMRQLGVGIQTYATDKERYPSPGIIGTANYDYLFGFRPLPQDNITRTEWERKGYSPASRSTNDDHFIS